MVDLHLVSALRTARSGPATRGELVSRWMREPGKTILKQVQAFLDALAPGHLRRAQELFALLEGLPYRDEVPSGRDLRGASLSGSIYGLELTDCDFSFAQLDLDFVNCVLSGARFDEAQASGMMLLKDLNRASFRRSRLVDCYFRDAVARECCFDGATLTGSSFAGADLRGSSFLDAKCRRATFTQATLSGCDFRRAIVDDPTVGALA